MKKTILMGMAAVALLASCSNDETMEVAKSSRAIEFNTFVNKSTRGAANDITTEKFNAFEVWGVMNKDAQTGTPFVKTSVTKSGDEWGYGTPVYWEDGFTYSFVAIAPAATNNNWTFTAPTTVGQWGSIAFDNGEGTTDLIYDVDGTHATTAVDLSAGAPDAISFTFNHLLSRVKFAFTNSMDDGSLINVTDVKITNANAKAVATLGETATWVLAADNQAGALAFGGVLLEEDATNFAANATEDTDHKYMIPATSEGQVYEVTFTVTREVNGLIYTYNHKVNLPEVSMVAGNSYRFTAELSAETIDPDTELYPIEFTVEEVVGWQDFTNVEGDILVEEPAEGEGE